MLDQRIYPSVPVFDFLEGFPPIILEALYYTTMICLILLLVKPHKLVVQILLFLSVFIAAIFEMASWQPWEYQYLCMIAIIILNRNHPKALYAGLILIMASIYFYSGLQKFNGGFLYSVWKGLILKQFLGFTDINLAIHYSGLALPIIEAIAGIGLLLSKSKRTAAYLLIGMHFFILILLFTVQGRSIVLPWNFVMIIILHQLFIINNYQFILSKCLYKFNIIIIFILWGIMPILSFFGYWEQKLSSNLYSGRYRNLAICAEIESDLLKPYIYKNKIKYSACQTGQYISISSLTLTEMSILPPTSDFYYLKVKKRFSSRFPELNIKCYIRTYPYKVDSEIK